MMNAIKLIIYYMLIAKLPHSRLFRFSNWVRVRYLAKVMTVCSGVEGTKVEHNVYLSDSKGIKIGKSCRINENVFLQGDVEIGDYCMLAPSVAIYSTTHRYENVDTPMLLQGDADRRKVIIGDDVWIGRNSVVLPGVVIGNGAIIGANSVVNRDVPSFMVYGGVPAKPLRNRK